MRIFFLFIILTSGLLYSQNDLTEVELSPRIGSEMDLYERNYFRVFMKVDSFQIAHFYKNTTGNYLVKITYGDSKNPKDTIINLLPDVFTGLKFYIENYEIKTYIESGKVTLSDSLWNIVKPSTKYFKNQVSWMDRDKITYRKDLLYIDSLFFVVWDGEGYYDWREIDKNIKIIFYNQVMSISSHFVGGNLFKYKQYLDVIRGLLSFIDSFDDGYFYPKELLDYISTNIEKFIEQVNIIKDVPKEKTYLKKLRGLGIGANIGLPLFFSPNYILLKNYTNYLIDPYYEDIEISYPLFIYTIFIEKEFIFENNFIGASFYFSQPSINKSADFQFNYSSINIYYKYGNILLKDAYIEQNKLLDIFNYSLALGVSIRTANFKDNLHKSYYPENIDPYVINSNLNDIGLYSSAAFYYSIFNNLFINLDVSFLYFPQNFSPLKETSWTVNGHKGEQHIEAVNLSSLNLSFGLIWYVIY